MGKQPAESKPTRKGHKSSPKHQADARVPPPIRTERMMASSQGAMASSQGATASPRWEARRAKLRRSMKVARRRIKRAKSDLEAREKEVDRAIGDVRSGSYSYRTRVALCLLNYAPRNLLRRALAAAGDQAAMEEESAIDTLTNARSDLQRVKLALHAQEPDPYDSDFARTTPLFGSDAHGPDFYNPDSPWDGPQEPDQDSDDNSAYTPASPGYDLGYTPTSPGYGPGSPVYVE